MTNSDTPRRRADLNAETKIQFAVLEFIRAVAPDCFVFHIANGGYRTPAEAARFRWQGVVAGVPDLCLVAPGGRVHFIEVKTPGGSLSAAQREIHEILARLGAPVAIARGVDDARRALTAWGIEMREAKMNANPPAGHGQPSMLSDFVLIARRCRLPNGSVDISAFLDAVGSEIFPDGRAAVSASLLLEAIEDAEGVRR